jgi:hypothetical protein
MKRRLSCEAVASAGLGPYVRREGAELLWRCPQGARHKNGDAHPSLKVNLKKNVWGCFVCGAKGTAWALAAFVAGIEASDKSAIIAWLRERGLFDVRPNKNGNRTHPNASSETKSRRIAEFYYTPRLRKVRIEPGRNGKSKNSPGSIVRVRSGRNAGRRRTNRMVAGTKIHFTPTGSSMKPTN